LCGINRINERDKQDQQNSSRFLKPTAFCLGVEECGATAIPRKSRLAPQKFDRIKGLKYREAVFEIYNFEIW
jgi:hypothetical protein